MATNKTTGKKLSADPHKSPEWAAVCDRAARMIETYGITATRTWIAKIRSGAPESTPVVGNGEARQHFLAIVDEIQKQRSCDRQKAMGLAIAQAPALHKQWLAEAQG